METRLRRLEREAKLYRLLLLAGAGWTLFCGQKPSVVEYDQVRCRQLVVSRDGSKCVTTIGYDGAGEGGVMISDAATGAPRASLLAGYDAELRMARDDTGPIASLACRNSTATLSVMSHDMKRMGMVTAMNENQPVLAVLDDDTGHRYMIAPIGPAQK